MDKEQFKAARVKLNLTQEQMAEALGLNSSRMIRQYESGRVPIRETIEKLVQLLLR
jgi:hypothetical protein